MYISNLDLNQRNKRRSLREFYWEVRTEQMPRWGVFSTVGRPAPQELVKKVQKSLRALESASIEKDKREQELKHIR